MHYTGWDTSPNRLADITAKIILLPLCGDNRPLQLGDVPARDFIGHYGQQFRFGELRMAQWVTSPAHGGAALQQAVHDTAARCCPGASATAWSRHSVWNGWRALCATTEGRRCSAAIKRRSSPPRPLPTCSSTKARHQHGRARAGLRPRSTSTPGTGAAPVGAVGSTGAAWVMPLARTVAQRIGYRIEDATISQGRKMRQVNKLPCRHISTRNPAGRCCNTQTLIFNDGTGRISRARPPRPVSGAKGPPALPRRAA